MSQLLQEVIHISNFLMCLRKLLVNDSKAVFVLVIFLEITLRVVRRRQQRVQIDGQLSLLLIVIVNQCDLLVSLANLMQGGE
ncbi:hypothetical protein D1872_318490 [compost metagenome]